MKSSFPSLASLRTFEAAGRHLSFTRAAIELHITQSAVSRQMQSLENYLGIRLFNRSPQRITLTPAGTTYLNDIRDTLSRIQQATLKLLSEEGGGMLSIATPPAFGMRWLIPRLSRFHSRNPDIMITLITRNAVFDLAAEGVDAAIHYGNSDWPNVGSVRLTGEQVVVVGSRAYLRQLSPLRSPKDIRKAVLLQHMRRPNAWRDWMTGLGVEGANPLAGPRFEHYFMLIQAAVVGLGLALIPRIIIAEELQAGRLVAPFKTDFASHESYCLVYPNDKADDPKLRRFREWLVEEAGRSGTH